MTVDHSHLAPYALDALPDDEQREFEAHLASCAECTAELAGFVETAARLGSAETTPVPARLRAAVLEQASRTPQVRPLGSTHRRSAWPRRVQRGVLAAAAVVLVAGVVGFFVEHEQADDLRADQTAVSRVLGAPDVVATSADLTDGGTVTVARSARLGRAVVALADLPANERDRVYQLWVIRDDAARSRGVFTQDAPGSVSRLIDDVDPGDAVAITIEPEGGSKAPTTAPLAVVA